MMRVLWVEDQVEDNQEIWRRMEAHSTEISVVSTVSEALAMLAEESFDHIVLDLRLPLGDNPIVDKLSDIDYNGVHIVEFLESRGVLGQVPVCILTNFIAVAHSRFSKKPVTVLQKATFLRDFEEIIYGK